MHTKRAKAWVLVAVAAALLGALSSGAGAAGPSWQLVDNHQSACFKSGRASSSWYGIWVNGRWSHSLNIGISGLPAGGSFTTSYAPIAPGSSTGVYSLAYVQAQLAPTTPLGSYTAQLWATDGTTRERVPVTLVVKTRCGY